MEQFISYQTGKNHSIFWIPTFFQTDLRLLERNRVALMLWVPRKNGIKENDEENIFARGESESSVGERANLTPSSEWTKLELFTTRNRSVNAD